MELRAADFCAFCSSSCRSGAPYRNILIFSGRVRLFFTPRFCLSLPFRHPLFFMTVEQSTLWADERLGLLLCALGSTEIFVMVRVLLHSLSRCGFVSVHTAGGIEKCYSPCCARGCAAGCKAAKCIETCADSTCRGVASSGTAGGGVRTMGCTAGNTGGFPEDSGSELRLALSLYPLRNPCVVRARRLLNRWLCFQKKWCTGRADEVSRIFAG